MMYQMKMKFKQCIKARRKTKNSLSAYNDVDETPDKRNLIV